jgi:multidrug efflux system membrane fusion protein
VTIATVRQMSVPVTIPTVGTVEAEQTVQMHAQVGGQLIAIGFAEGQEVHKGDLLFTLDPRPFQAAVSQAQAVLSRDTATATNAQAERTRYDDLFKRGLIPREQYDAQIATSESAQATLAADRAAVETTQLNMQWSRITAPISGRTGGLGVHVGDLIRANDTTPMVVINQLTPIYVTFSVPGRYLPDIRKYQAQKRLAVHAAGQASVAPGALAAPPSAVQSLQSPGAPATPSAAPSSESGAASPVAPAAAEDGVVTFIDNTVDPTTATIKMKGTFQNSDRALWPGLFVQITLDLTTQQDVVVVPAPAVQASQAGQYVYVVKPDSTVEVSNIVVERQQGESMVVTSGVSPGEVVVTEGQLRLTPGIKVTTSGRGCTRGVTP